MMNGDCANSSALELHARSNAEDRDRGNAPATPSSLSAQEATLTTRMSASSMSSAGSIKAAGTTTNSTTSTKSVRPRKPTPSSSKSTTSSSGDKRTTVPHQQLPPRPKVEVSYPSVDHLCYLQDLPGDVNAVFRSHSRTGTSPTEWIELVRSQASAPLESFLHTLDQLIRHPERNSSNILRADILTETLHLTRSPRESSTGQVGQWVKHSTIQRRILPRRPNLDWEMSQDCCVYFRRHQIAQQTDGSTSTEDHEHEESEHRSRSASSDLEDVEEALVTYIPLVATLSHPKMKMNGPTSSDAGSPEDDEASLLGQPPPNEDYIPFYHPKVRAVGFHYSRKICGNGGESSSPTDASASSTERVYGGLSISILPFLNSTPSYPSEHRLSRVGLSLLTTIHMHSWGHLHAYQKRVHHDTVIPRERYQDTYLNLKNKYASHLIDGWKESTDPTKHVFEDLGIAAFLICLWEDMFASSQNDNDGTIHNHNDDQQQRRHPNQHEHVVVGDTGWKIKLKFVDVGCGNGLLVHILTMEGFRGVGLDLRARKSWSQYISSGSELNEWTFEPSSLITSEITITDDEKGGMEEGEAEARARAKFEESQRHFGDGGGKTNVFLIGNHADELTPWIPLLATYWGACGFINLPCCYYSLEGTKSFPLSLPSTVSRNEQYLAYISDLHQRFGWKMQLEPLRIPSTKNWCFVATKRSTTREENQEQYETARLEVVINLDQLKSSWLARVSKS